MIPRALPFAVSDLILHELMWNERTQPFSVLAEFTIVVIIFFFFHFWISLSCEWQIEKTIESNLIRWGSAGPKTYRLIIHSYRYVHLKAPQHVKVRVKIPPQRGKLPNTALFFQAISLTQSIVTCWEAGGTRREWLCVGTNVLRGREASSFKKGAATVFYFDTDGANDGPRRGRRRRRACGEQVFHGRAMSGAGQGAPERQRITFHSWFMLCTQ